MKHLLCFGFGFTAAALAARLDRSQWRVTGTSRTSTNLQSGVEILNFGELEKIPETVTHVLSSVPPDETGDPVAKKFASQLSRPFEWIGYLSTTGVYGDRGGGWVDEDSELKPGAERAKRRVAAEAAWRPFNAHIFRLPGIYGPGRNQLESVKDGTARRIVKQGQLFSRAHVADIAGVLAASMNRPNPGRVYNIADDEACPPQDVVTFACKLMGVAPPPFIAFEDAQLSPMARSFYEDSKRVSNNRIKQELGYTLQFPTYREGLTAIFNSSPHLRVRQG